MVAILGFIQLKKKKDELSPFGKKKIKKSIKKIKGAKISLLHDLSE